MARRNRRQKGQAMKYNFNLRCFDGEGTAPTADGIQGDTAKDTTAPATQTNTDSSEGDPSETALTQENERLNEYNDWKNEHKDLFQADVQKIINKRFKDTKILETNNQELQKQVSDVQPLLTALMQKYGVENQTDLLGEIEKDDSFFADAAEKEGMDVKSFKRLYQLEKENADFRAAKEQNEAHNHIDEIYSKWLSEAEETQQVYPNFDLQTESENPDFSKLLRSGIGVRQAYEVIHMDDIVKGVANLTAKEVKSKVSKSVSASRPDENGTSSHSSAVVKPDVSKMTKAEMDDIERRVMRGERITL